jgi:hypothetical protein
MGTHLIAPRGLLAIRYGSSIEILARKTSGNATSFNDSVVCFAGTA